MHCSEDSAWQIILLNPEHLMGALIKPAGSLKAALVLTYIQYVVVVRLFFLKAFSDFPPCTESFYFLYNLSKLFGNIVHL